MTWYDRAMRVIVVTYNAHKHLPEKEILDAIDAAYPFGARELHPYKQWLKARKAFIYQHLKTQYKPKQQGKLQGQQELEILG